jgi:3-phosphoshikimate 1-carboxyvinyltransferase
VTAVDVVIRPGGRLEGEAAVPGDKSIAHRWLILSVTAKGLSRLAGLPPSLDIRSTASCLSKVAPKARPSLDVFARDARSPVEGGGSTWNGGVEVLAAEPVEVEGDGRDALVRPPGDLDCGNSGTSMRLLAGVLAAAPFTSVLTGDPSLSVRPMERVASPLRTMGADVQTTDGHPPLRIGGSAALRGATFAPEVPSAQVKSAILFAGLAADGTTAVREPAATRDHTERALEALGAPVERDGSEVRIRRFQHAAFDARVPGDPSSSAFLIAAAALTGSALTISRVGLNPSRLHFLGVMTRMGITTRLVVEGSELGEPVGSIEVEPCDGVRAVQVEADELPLIIDEVPVLAALAIHAAADSWFLDAAELRVKESDRLGAITRSVRDLGGAAADEGDDLVIAGGGLDGGRTSSGGDHRIAMAMAVAALAARGPSRIDGMDAADVSFPGFVATLDRLGARIETP